MSRVAQLLPNVDYKKLPLTPVEGNVFTRIDGKASEDDIVRLTGYHKETVHKAIDRLIELGAAQDIETLKAKEASARDARSVATTALGGFDPNAAPIYEARELDEEADLDLVKKKQILDAYYRLDKLTLYELLGVHQLVDKKQIKAAYYQLAPEYHPDKFFRRNLGTFRPKIEAIFAKLTLAHDTLSSKQRRAEYDEYLLQQPERHVAAPVAQATQPLVPTPGQPAAAPPGPAPDEAKRQALLAERRRALAAKLGGARVPAPSDSQPSTQAGAPPPIDPRAAAEALRVRYEVAKAQSNVSQVRKYVDSGRDALHRKDYAAAVNAFRIAISLAPDDAEVAREAADVNQQAAVAMADTFMRQGEMEANQERWSDAAISFSKACQGKPTDARLHDRAAHATFKANNNPRRAVEFARKAVELAGKQPMYRITLAYAYMASGLETSARSELERAIEISNGDDRVKAAVAAAREALKVMAHTPKAEERPRTATPAAAGPAAHAPLVPPPDQRGAAPVIPPASSPPGVRSSALPSPGRVLVHPAGRAASVAPPGAPVSQRAPGVCAGRGPVPHGSPPFAAPPERAPPGRARARGTVVRCSASAPSVALLSADAPAAANAAHGAAPNPVVRPDVRPPAGLPVRGVAAAGIPASATRPPADPERSLPAGLPRPTVGLSRADSALSDGTAAPPRSAEGRARTAVIGGWGAKTQASVFTPERETIQCTSQRCPHARAHGVRQERSRMLRYVPSRAGEARRPTQEPHGSVIGIA
ncbi:MAG: DnaJ domain-containing protein [Polyangiaceae bacterium]